MRDSKRLHPKLQIYVMFGLYRCYKMGLNVRITETIRTIDEQNAFYAQGTSQVKGSDFGSMHQWGVAFDVCRNDGNGAYDFNGWIDKVQKIFKDYPLAWGGDWKGFVDQPHFQMKSYEDDIGGVSKLKNKYKNPDAFIKTWNKSKITQQFSNLSTADTKKLLDSCMTITKSEVDVWSTERTIGRKCKLPKGSVVYIMKDTGNGRSKVIYITNGATHTGYIYNYKLEKSLSNFKTKMVLSANKNLYKNKYDSAKKKVLHGSSTGITLKKGSSVKVVEQYGSWIKIRTIDKINGAYKLGWIKA